jgi:membrane protein
MAPGVGRYRLEEGGQILGCSAAVRALDRDHIRVFGHVWPLAGPSGAVLYALGVAGMVLLFTALYMILPAGRVRLRHALIGALTATVLWEAIRRVLVWYFERLSMVHVIYGPLATTIVVLLTLEAAALIFLLGAQVAADVDRSRGRYGPPEPPGLDLGEGSGGGRA